MNLSLITCKYDLSWWKMVKAHLFSVTDGLLSWMNQMVRDSVRDPMYVCVYVLVCSKSL